jgi:glycosyltransferase involved in cell wall biosynthesis
MRVAFFHNLPPGGGKRSAYEWVKRMSQKHEVDLYLCDPRAEDFLDIRPLVNKTIIVGEDSTVSQGYIGRLSSLNRVSHLSRRMAEKINSGGYDLALVMQCRVSNSPFVLRHLKIPSLYFCHEPLIRMLEPHYPAKWKDGYLSFIKKQVVNAYISLDRSNAVKASLICTSSLYSRENLYRAYGLYPRLNYPGVDTEHFHPLGNERDDIVLSVGSLNPSKGHDFVIKSVSTIREEVRPKVKIIYSSEHYRIDYREQLARLGEQLRVSVVFDSLITDDDLVRAYNTAMITACPNLLEPLGLVALESMACGTPVVGVAEAGIRETVQHNENGLLTERDTHEFGRAISELMQNKSMWIKMSHLGRSRVLERWTWDQSFEKLDIHMQMASGMR